MMKVKLNKKDKRIILIYLIVFAVLFIIVRVVPEATDAFETTQLLEPGKLTLSCEAEGYFIKDEYVGVADRSGDIHYNVAEGTAVKKGHTLASVEPGDRSGGEPRFEKYMEKLHGFDGLSKGCESPASGVFGFDIDGYEGVFVPEKMQSLDRDTVEGLRFDPADLERASAVKGEPLYKVSADDKWYVLCWIDPDTAETYYEGMKARLELPEGTVDAEVHSIKKDGRDFRVIFGLDVYYKAFSETRKADMNIVVSDNEGLIVDNGCIIEKDGRQGVYVKNKDGEYIFTRIKVISTDGKDSAIEDANFIDEEGLQVPTVDVYDEVLRHPAGALEKELEEESMEKASEDHGRKEAH